MPPTDFILDYAIFALLFIASLIAITVWFRLTSRADGMLVLAWIFLAVLVVGGYFLVNSANVRERSRLKSQIAGFAPTYASELEAMGHERIQFGISPDDPLYVAMIEKQIEWQKLNPAIADIYTFRQHPDGNQLFVDSETDYDRNGVIEGNRESRTRIGEVWAEKNEWLVKAYAGEETFDDTIYTDRWGTWVSAYVPMKDSDGQVDAVLGVDFPAQDWVSSIKRARRSVIGYLSALATIVLASTVIITVLRGNLAERRKSESQLREVALRTRLIIDTAYSAFVACDQDGKIVDWNPKAETFFGWKREEAMGKALTETIIPPSYADAHSAGMERYLSTGKPKVLNQLLELTAMRKDGFEFPVELTITPLCIGGEHTFFAFLHDISERKKAESELLSAKDDAEAATKAKSEFLANMSHEIRTPMNGIIGMSELLANTKLDVQQKDYLEMVRVSAHSLLRLLNDILDFSKIEAGKLELENVDFGLRDCVSKAAQTLASRASEKNVELACRIAPEIPDGLVGDPGRLGQIIVNLVGNAVKFTDEGEVVVDVQVQDVTEDYAYLHFSVKDSGVGIPADKRDKIFDVFDQADASTTRRFGGTGLGLAISRQLVELMQGRIWVESEIGEGSIFQFTARFGISLAPTTEESDALAQLANVPIMVVDDNQTNRRIFEEILKSWKMNSVIAHDGETALRELRRAAADNAPIELLLTDCMMPGMDGFELAEKIRADQTISNCSIVMVSSGASPEDAEKCRRMGITRYMLKPVIQSELRQTILSAVAQSSAHQPALEDSKAGDTMPPITKALDILLVEDGIVNQKVAAGLLKGHHVVIANNGLEAIESMDKEKFDIVFMDVQMPKMDGFEATKAIREIEESTGHHTPIIAMTASAMKGDREKCLAAGMDSYISKPVTAKQLRSEIEKVSSGLVQQRSSTESSQQEIPSSSANDFEIIDPSVALERVGGDRNEAKAIANLMIDQCPVMLNELRDGLKTENSQRVQRAAHTIKGTADVFGANDVVKVAQVIESAGESGDLKSANGEFPDLETLVDRLRTELVAYVEQ